MEKIKFGPAGADASYTSKKGKTKDLPKYLSDIGLDALEISFGRGIILGDALCSVIKEEAEKNNIEISIHAPYYINFANLNEEMVQKSFGYVINSLKKLRLMGGKRLVFHTGSNGKLSREEAYQIAYKNLERLKDMIYEEGLEDMYVCPETMGKYTQIGNTTEVVNFCKIDKIFKPTLDFGHLNCLKQGALKTKEDFINELKIVIDGLGYERAKNLHIHFSKIEYSSKGEVKHVDYGDEGYGPNIEPLFEALNELKLYPVIICESKNNRIEDSLTYKKIYEKMI